MDNLITPLHEGPGDIAPRILIVEDENLTRNALAEFLGSEGHTVHCASAGSEALKRFDKGKYNLVITDLHMPGMSGIELIKAMRAIDQDTRFIIITGSLDARYSIQALRMGIHDYILKPFDFEELSTSVSKAMIVDRRRKLRQEYHNVLERKIFKLDERFRLLFFDAVQSLVNAIEAKDPYTSGHSIRVTMYSMDIAAKADLPYETISEIGLAAQLHDVGKMGISETILNKPGKLSIEEFGLIKKHPLLSCQILKPIFKDRTLEYVRHHHERWNGKGYPEKLSGDKIPIGSRIIALADSFDAMVSDRAYRKAIREDRALEEIYRERGRQFDPALVPHLVSAVESRALEDASAG